MKKQIITITVIIFISILGGTLYFFDDYLRPPYGAVIKEELLLKAPKEKILESKEIDWIEQKEDGTIENKGKIKKYDYISDKEVPVEKGEDISKRTGNAKFFKKELTEQGQVYEGRFYSGTPFIKQNGKWYQTETATTSIEAFDEQVKPTLINRLKIYFARGALATELTPVYSGAGDGRVYRAAEATWTAARDTADGDGANTTETASHLNAAYAGAAYYCDRNFFPIDTSALPDDAIISAADFVVVLDDQVGTADVGLIQTSQASPTALAVGDFDALTLNTPDEGATRLNFNITETKTFTLNATGISWISKTSYTLLGLRQNHDIDNVTPTENNDKIIRMSEYADTASDPYLSVTYTEPVTGEERHIMSPITF